MAPLPKSILSFTRVLAAVEADLELWVYIMLTLIVVVLLFFSAIFSATETALSTVSSIRIRKLAEENKRGAKKALILIENYDRLITTILIGNNLVNIGASTVAAFIFTHLILNPSVASIVSTAVMTLLVVTFCEIIPKIYAKANATKLALIVSGLMWFFYKIFYPIAIIYTKITQRAGKKTEHAEHTVTGDELESIIETMEDQGVFDEDHADIIHGAVSLGNKKVAEIMTPRVDVVAVGIDHTPREILDVFLETQFSRLPVYDTDKDNIVGVLQVKDFLIAMIQTENHKDINLLDLLVEPLYVSKQTKVDDLIKVMQDEKKHFAIVSDEYGGTSGVVTMEDALEELVGEIYDEYDDDEKDPFLIKESENTYYLSADLELDELYDTLDLGSPQEDRYLTVGSYIYELCEGLPEESQTITVTSAKTNFVDNEFIDKKYLLTFELVKVENRRIRELNLTVLDITDVDEEEIEKLNNENDNQ